MSPDDRPARYTFGDSPIASERLGRVARVFAPTTRALPATLRTTPRLRIVDLGCGPGHSSRLLGEVFPEARVIGIDRSLPFLDEARARGGPRDDFRPGDVSRLPLPAAPWADLVYARFVLQHLVDRAALLRGWFDLLSPGGALVLEEVEWIETGDDVFRTYLGITGGLIAHGGGDLYAGREIAAAAAGLDGRLVHDAVATLPVSAADAAGMFTLNLRTLRDDPWVRARHDEAALDALAAGLDRRLDPQHPATIRWGLRQLVVAR